MDVICGDLNMARWIKGKEDASKWHEGTLGELEGRDYIPVADYSQECCFVAVHESIAQTLHIKGSSWGEQGQSQDTEQRHVFHQSFLEQVGAKPTSRDVHWPMTLALRMPASVRASGLRQRSKAATQRRNDKKRQKCHLPTYSWSAAPAAPAVRGSDSGWRGRSSGSGRGSGEHDDSGGRSGSGWHSRSSGSAEWRR